jgi:hypothetical protein
MCLPKCRRACAQKRPRTKADTVLGRAGQELKALIAKRVAMQQLIK